MTSSEYPYSPHSAGNISLDCNFKTDWLSDGQNKNELFFCFLHHYNVSLTTASREKCIRYFQNGLKTPTYNPQSNLSTLLQYKSRSNTLSRSLSQKDPKHTKVPRSQAARTHHHDHTHKQKRHPTAYLAVRHTAEEIY